MSSNQSNAAAREMPKATVGETLGVLAGVIAPVFARGVIIRRPAIVALAERLDLDRRAVKRVQGLRSRYGTGPLLLKVPFRKQVLLLDPVHVQQVLDVSPDPFTPATWEKRSALSHFQPQGVLISQGPERTARRRFNEGVLDSEHIVHKLADSFVPVVNDEAHTLLDAVQDSGVLTWDTFADAWFRIVRRVVFGDAARDDQELTGLVNSLRSDANWAFMKPKRTALRRRFYQHMHTYLERAEPGSLAAMMAATPKDQATSPDQQVPQWLFAFDPAGMTTFRALALLASHPAHMQRARDEIAGVREERYPELPFLRATVLESLRLWPTTPMLLRETTRATTIGDVTVTKNAHLIVFANYFHRDTLNLPYANHFAPDIWMADGPDKDWPFVQFSAGPAECPGRNLVLLLTSHMLRNLINDNDVRLGSHRKLRVRKELPGTLNNYGLRFTVSPLAGISNPE